jgi:hypothetical protein
LFSGCSARHSTTELLDLDRHRCALVHKKIKRCARASLRQSHGPKAPAQFCSRQRRCPRQICALGRRFGCETIVAKPKASAAWARGYQGLHGDSRPCTIARRSNALRIERLIGQHIGLAWQLHLIGRLTRPGDICGQERQASQPQEPKACETAPGVSHGPGSLPESRWRQANRGASTNHGGADGKVSRSASAGGRKMSKDRKGLSQSHACGACLAWGRTIPTA